MTIEVFDAFGSELKEGDWVLNSYNITRNQSGIRFSRIHEIYKTGRYVKVKLINYYPSAADQTWHKGNTSAVYNHALRTALKVDASDVPGSIIAAHEELINPTPKVEAI